MGVARGHPGKQLWGVQGSDRPDPVRIAAPDTSEVLLCRRNPQGGVERAGERQVLSSTQFLKTPQWQKQLGKQILPPCWSYGIGAPEYSSLPCATRPPHSSPGCCCSRDWGERPMSWGTPPMPETREGAPLCKTPIPGVVSHVLTCRGLFPIGNPHLGFIPPMSPVSAGAQVRWLLTQCQKKPRLSCCKTQKRPGKR